MRPDEPGMKVCQGGIAYEGAAFGHAVAYGEPEADAVEKRFDFAVERSAAGYHFFEFSSESFGQPAADLGVDRAVEKR